MRQQNVHLARVPGPFVVRATVHAHPQAQRIKGGEDAGEVVLKPVEQQSVLTVQTLDQLHQRGQLAVMDGDNLALLIVHSPIAEL